ncbi:hypothetical protein KW586_000220 [Escherichia coli]|nr:hypothetical protein [Escherichia coli]EHQ5525037.1 hypothetical protein [Escherichia coli O2]EGP5936829.1 hypothetical protein [Escherichia coli]EHK9649700.1 hypothetical protein [Escherichia coli]EHT0613707.1 hypothetical protein [Escherichia coli]
MVMDIKNECNQAIKTSYLDMANPNFAFVMEGCNSSKYKEIISAFSSRFDIRDNTELNYDVCLSLEVVLQKGIAFIYISLVGQYAFIIFKDDVITSSMNIGAEIADLINVLIRHDFKILDKDFLLSKPGCDIYPGLSNSNEMYLNYLFSPGLKIK